jgi:hypothetical protein
VRPAIASPAPPHHHRRSPKSPGVSMSPPQSGGNNPARTSR